MRETKTTYFSKITSILNVIDLVFLSEMKQILITLINNLILVHSTGKVKRLFLSYRLLHLTIEPNWSNDETLTYISLTDP